MKNTIFSNPFFIIKKKKEETREGEGVSKCKPVTGNLLLATCFSIK
jgi:hypothetical protein